MIREKEFDQLKKLIDIIGIAKTCKVTGRGRASVGYVSVASDYADYMKQRTIRLGKAKTKLVKSEPDQPVKADKLALNQFNTIVSLLQAIEYDLQKLINK
jgi:hypothetical protein